MADKSTAQASKYAGKVKVGGGPVPLKSWADRDRAHTAIGSDLRGERKPSVSFSHPK